MAQVKTEHRKGEPSKTTCREICRYYINGKGQCEVIGLKRTMRPYLDCFSYNEGMALRYDNDTYSHLATFPLYPKMEVIPELERNGFTGDLYGLAPLAMFKAILRDRSTLFACKANNLNQLTKLTHQTSLYHTNYRLKEVLDGVMEIIRSALPLALARTTIVRRRRKDR